MVLLNFIVHAHIDIHHAYTYHLLPLTHGVTLKPIGKPYNTQMKHLRIQDKILKLCLKWRKQSKM